MAQPANQATSLPSVRLVNRQLYPRCSRLQVLQIGQHVTLHRNLVLNQQLNPAASQVTHQVRIRPEDQPIVQLVCRQILQVCNPLDSRHQNLHILQLVHLQCSRQRSQLDSHLCSHPVNLHLNPPFRQLCSQLNSQARNQRSNQLVYRPFNRLGSRLISHPRSPVRYRLVNHPQCPHLNHQACRRYSLRYNHRYSQLHCQRVSLHRYPQRSHLDALLVNPLGNQLANLPVSHRDNQVVTLLANPLLHQAVLQQVLHQTSRLLALRYSPHLLPLHYQLVSQVVVRRLLQVYSRQALHPVSLQRYQVVNQQ